MSAHVGGVVQRITKLKLRFPENLLKVRQNLSSMFA